MKAKYNRREIFAISAILLLAMSAIMASISISEAAQVPNRKTTAYLSVNPKLVGLNQEMTVNMWIYPSPTGPHFSGGRLAQMEFTGLTITFTRPDGTKDTFMPTDGSGGLAPGQSETIGALWFLYKPNQVGNWTAQFSFPGATFDDKPTTNDTVTYEPATSQLVTFTVQNDAVRVGMDPVPLPTDYWTKPINANNREWYAVGGDWLQNTYNAAVTSFNPYSDAPDSGHILWTNQVSAGGIIGGLWGSLSYEDSVGGNPPIIMMGKVYYNMPGTVFRCVDLYTVRYFTQHRVH
jgi:hypothetical protein